MAIINPYSGVSFSSYERILSVSHQHLSHDTSLTQAGITHTQEQFNYIHNSGVRHFPLSRYRPSIVTYPFDYETNEFLYVANDMYESPTLPPSGLRERDSTTVHINDDDIGSPNAEHTYFDIYQTLQSGKAMWDKYHNIHINGMGSLFESADVPSASTGYAPPIGGLKYTEVIDGIVNNLLYPDGGGAIINHPDWTHNRPPAGRYPVNMERFTIDCLDYNPLVLGTDMIEDGLLYHIPANTVMIDNILKTGRRCWIFCQPDWNWDNYKKYQFGRNELLIPSGLSRAEQEHACLKAYRDGAFFGRLSNSAITGLSITSVGYENGTFTVSAIGADKIGVVVDGVATEEAVSPSNESTVTVSNLSGNIYVRAYAYLSRDDSREPDWPYRDKEPNWEHGPDLYKDIVFTNPIMIRPQTYTYYPMYEEKNLNERFWLLS